MNRQVKALLAFVALVVATSMLLSARVALQVGYTDALRDQRELRAESELLRNRLAVLDRGAKAFLSRDSVEKAGRERFGLDYRELPVNIGEAAR